jgi:hypothetical protein
VFAAREPSTELAGLPEFAVQGLRELDARALLDSALSGPLDTRVRELIVAETRGNPLALLELPRGLTQAELAGGFGLPGVVPLTGQIEESFRRQPEALPATTRRLLVLAAADPSGNPSLVWQAAGRLDIPPAAAQPAQEAELVDFGIQVSIPKITRVLGASRSKACSIPDRPFYASGCSRPMLVDGPSCPDTPHAHVIWNAYRCGSGIRWCVRRLTGRHRRRTGGRRTGRWRR